VHRLFESIDLIHDPEPHPVALNMAVDEVLLQRLDRPLLRIYQWLRPSVSFGYFEKYEAVLAAHPGRDLVRRWTGGGVVPHGEDLTYSLLVPAGSAFMRLKTADSYRAIHERIAGAMNRAGVVVSMAGGADEKISQACFENPTRHDILQQGRKIAGAAQRRTKFGLLHQGSIQNVELPVSFEETLAAEFSGCVNTRKIKRTELKAALALAEMKYATDAWMRKF
jgi:lipoate-protein ligase A